MLLLNQVAEVAKKLPETRDELLKTISRSTWEEENNKNLAFTIVSYVDVYHLNVFENYVYMNEINLFSVHYSDFSVKNGDICSMRNFIENVCKQINEISTVLQFSLFRLEPVSEDTIYIVIQSRF